MRIIIGIAGWSGAGKTTLILKLIPCLRRRASGSSTLKHAHHMFDVDQPGKDSPFAPHGGRYGSADRLREPLRSEHELRGAPEPPLELLIGKLSAVDLDLVEGFQARSASQDRGFRQANGSRP